MPVMTESGRLLEPVLGAVVWPPDHSSRALADILVLRRPNSPNLLLSVLHISVRVRSRGYGLVFLDRRLHRPILL